MTLQLLQPPTLNRCVTLRDISWEQLEIIQATMQSIAGVRLTYLDGTLDIIYPVSPDRENLKSIIAQLLEIYLRSAGIQFYARGSPTLGNRDVGARGEPDDAYNLETEKALPDIAIEVVASCGVDKLEKYNRWRVPEVWLWENQQLSVYHLRHKGYQEISQSQFLPELDLQMLMSCAMMSDRHEAVMRFGQAIRLTQTLR